MKITSNLRHLMMSLLLVAMSGVLPAGAADENRAVHWETYREALASGQREDKPILIHFTASYSTLCKKMIRTTYADRHVIRLLNEHFAVTMVDIEQVSSLARKYKVKEVPVLWFLDAEGKPLTSIRGEVGPEKLLRVGEYITQKIYEHTDYNTWLDKRSSR